MKASPIQAPLASCARGGGAAGLRKVFTSASTMDSAAAAAPPVCGTLAGGIVALGKFDALHIGHRALAEQAARMGGFPILLSFAGMGEILGWEKRLPLVAPCDRTRVMSLWSSYCGGQTPGEYSLEFAKIRHLSPEEFVDKLSAELQVRGVVAGRNYRFGYRAAGDALELERLCKDRGLEVFVVEPVMDRFDQAPTCLDAKDRGQVSSTRVRNALSQGKMRRVHELLGRRHRLVARLAQGFNSNNSHGRVLRLPLSDALNQPPAAGCYSSCTVVYSNGEQADCKVTITADDIVVEGLVDQLQLRSGLMSIDF